ncbi:hypothetical protein L596_000660 [Steinernema carpocapsae]|uniref:Uncharacterized protein n=1 Tax=Steinernema carpocapsae TaxID=34508 RepID=A0A4U8UL54_STECR|nr:hypothetical protein L596_000660 [Steinernema carpocapsae]
MPDRKHQYALRILTLMTLISKLQLSSSTERQSGKFRLLLHTLFDSAYHPSKYSNKRCSCKVHSNGSCFFNIFCLLNASSSSYRANSAQKFSKLNRPHKIFEAFADF